MRDSIQIRLTIWILWTLGISAISLDGQPNLLQGTIQHTDGGKIYLASYWEDRFSLTDSLDSPSGAFHFMIPCTGKPGIYRIIYNEEFGGILTENRFVEFICNREDLVLNVTSAESGPVPGFNGSTENQVYLEFMKFQLDYESRLLESYSQLFPAGPGLPAYDSAVILYEDLQIHRNRFMDSLSAVHPDLYATRIMNAFRAPVVPGNMSHTRRIDTLKEIFFEKAALDDPALLGAPVYTYRIVDYLSLYRVDTLSQADQEAAFMEAVDQIMLHTGPDPGLHSFVVEFMLEGFEMLGMESVQVHLADHYLDESCGSDVAELVASRMEGYRKMALGSTVPDFEVRDLKGRVHRLSDLGNPYVLVMFWASTCEHCRGMIPELRRWYLEENSKDLEVVAISIDSLESACRDYAETAEMPWITAHAMLGWHSSLADDYHVYATPAMFLLDEKRTILSRPIHFRQFQRAARKLGN
jgi:peroxiredoxin